MPFALAPEHRKFFNKNHHIAFEDLLSSQEVDDLKENADNILAKKLRCTLPTLPLKTTKELCQNGYDLWRQSPVIKKISLSRKLAEIASELFFKKPLRIGHDQYFRPSKDPYVFSHRLMETSSFDEIAGALLIQLSDTEPHPIFPSKKGSGLFVSAKFFMDFQISSPIFLIVYCPEKARYFPHAKDPHAIEMKKVGYQSGELLDNVKSPIVFS